jgi:hypothetical protein
MGVEYFYISIISIAASDTILTPMGSNLRLMIKCIYSGPAKGTVMARMVHETGNSDFSTFEQFNM